MTIADIYGSITHATAVGSRSYQEDRYFTAIHTDGMLFGMFDGHGGENCSTYLAEHFPKVFFNHLDNCSLGLDPVNRPLNGARLAFQRTFAAMAKGTNLMHDGSTASVAWIPRTEKDGGRKWNKVPDTAVVAVLGDSPVVIGTPRGFHVSPDHNARSNEKECQAAVKRGARWDGNYLWNQEWGMCAHGLQMARAFGDADLPFLSRIPQIYTRPIYDFVLVGTDGLFDPGHKSKTAIKDAVDVIRHNPAWDAQRLVDAAVALPTGDNVTAILWRKS
jgi:serine/threonine protein phosphatase PrpC